VSSYLTTASNEFEAQIIAERLEEAGISAIQKSPLGPRWGDGGRRDLYVEDRDLARARQTLKDAEATSEQELDRLSEEAPPPSD
jgi:hypothetical protein